MGALEKRAVKLKILRKLVRLHPNFMNFAGVKYSSVLHVWFKQRLADKQWSKASPIRFSGDQQEQEQEQER